MPQVRAVTLASYLNVARSVGLDGHALLAEHGIPADFLTNPESRFEAVKMGALIADSVVRSGCDSFGLRMAQARQFESIGPLVLLLQHLPTLRDVMTAMIDYRRSVSDVTEIALEEAGDSAILIFDLNSGTKVVQSYDLQLGLGFVAIRGVMGPSWQPEAVCLTRKTPRDLATFQRFFAAPLQFEARRNGFVVDRRMLDRAPPLANPTLANHAQGLMQTIRREPAPADICDAVRRAITLLLPMGRATLAHVADNLNTPQRTLQRSLFQVDMTFGQLLEQVRRDMALRYIEGSRRALAEVSQDCGYATQSAFSRWFAREFGMSPQRWRNRSIARETDLVRQSASA